MAETSASDGAGPQSLRAEQDPNTTLVWAKIWDVSSPPPSNTYKVRMMCVHKVVFSFKNSHMWPLVSPGTNDAKIHEPKASPNKH